tara:strand:- start:421 stop:930 length:510 start_codon:yes stop_codon:yes gene_type:complete
MRKTLFFTSLAVATGITILEIFIFFNHFAKITQINLNNTMELLADNTYAFIKKNYDYKKAKSEIYKLKLYIDDVHKISDKRDKKNNYQLVIKSIVLILLLGISVILSYVTLDNKYNIKKEYIGIILGIITGSITQFMFVKYFVFQYQSSSENSLLNYILNKLSDIIRIC